MSTPKIIRVYSPSSKSQNNKQTTCTQGHRQRSSLDTVITHQKTSQMQNYYSLLIDQVKKLSKDNDRMWKLLTQTEQQHSECNKTQSQLQKSLQCAQKQLVLMKEMYQSQKSNFEQSKTFFEKRQIEWQEIVGQLKKVIENYECTNNLDMNRASQIFNQTSEMKSPHKIDQLPHFDKELSIYSKKNSKLNASQFHLHFQSHYQTEYQQNDQESNLKYTENNLRQLSQSGSLMSTGEKKHRSKLFRSKNFINKGNGASLSAKKICEKIYAQEMHKLEFTPQTNPEDAIQMLTMEDIFQRSIRKTYIQYRNHDQKCSDIMGLNHMQKLKTAKSSTKERLNKTIRKIFAFDSQQELDDVINYIQEKVYKKYHLLKGQLIFKFLQDRFKQCEQIFQSSNSALDRLDKEPSNLINGAVMNSKFRDYEQKKKEIRSNEATSLRGTQMMKTQLRREGDQMSNCSRGSSHMGGLSINSNIKEKTFRVTHYNNHMTSLQKEVQRPQQRDNSKKNIYTEERISRRGFVEQLSRSNKSISMEGSQMTKNLSSLIGASQEYEINAGNYWQRNESSKGIYNNRTADESRM